MEMFDGDTLTCQMLELTMQLANSVSPSTSLSTTKYINFSCSCHDRNHPSKTAQRTKKKSPSHKKDDFLRKNTFLKKKMEESYSENYFTYELCDFLAQPRIQLNIHMVKEHENLDQLDGNTSLISTKVDNKELTNEEEPAQIILKFNK